MLSDMQRQLVRGVFNQSAHFDVTWKSDSHCVLQYKVGTTRDKRNRNKRKEDKRLFLNRFTDLKVEGIFEHIKVKYDRSDTWGTKYNINFLLSTAPELMLLQIKFAKLSDIICGHFRQGPHGSVEDKSQILFELNSQLTSAEYQKALSMLELGAATDLPSAVPAIVLPRVLAEDIPEAMPLSGFSESPTIVTVSESASPTSPISPYAPLYSLQHSPVPDVNVLGEQEQKFQSANLVAFFEIGVQVMRQHRQALAEQAQVAAFFATDPVENRSKRKTVADEEDVESSFSEEKPDESAAKKIKVSSHSMFSPPGLKLTPIALPGGQQVDVPENAYKWLVARGAI